MGNFNAVVTTGIYCRPGCGGRPNRANVREFALAASAEAAGFRACLRCRPYRAQPSLSGPQAPELLCRAVRLIVNGALDEGTEQDLGARLGVSGRHLRRLFSAQLGLTPDQLARSTRVHFARRLLEETGLSVSEVAFAAGFGTARQLNRDCRAVFRATPGELRARRRVRDRLVADSGISLRVPFQPPLDWPALLACLAARAIPGVEEVSAGRYRRTIVSGGDSGVLEVSAGGPDHLLLHAHLPHWAGLIHTVRAARGIFNLDADAGAADARLAAAPVVGALCRDRPGARPAGAWDPFEAAIEAILGAAAGRAATAAAMGRIAERYGRSVPGLRDLGLSHTFPPPSALTGAALRDVGLTAPQAAAVHTLARIAADAGDGQLAEALTAAVAAIPGPGPDAARRLALRLGEPDAFAPADPALLAALARVTGHPVTARQAEDLAEPWRPWRAHATAYLWRAVPAAL